MAVRGAAHPGVGLFSWDLAWEEADMPVWSRMALFFFELSVPHVS